MGQLEHHLSQKTMDSLFQKLKQKKFLSLQQKDVVSSDMINRKNLGYEGEFYFGNPPQKMQVIFDTGSCWAWVFSEKCQESGCPLKNKKYMQT